jgi:all-trans-retinol 13,14-reductase
MRAHAIGTPYKQFHADDRDRFDAIVIGSGVGGLGAAALLAKSAGWRVLVLERHYTAGGLSHVFNRPGFEWDIGMHYVGQVHIPDSPAAAWFTYLTEGRLTWHSLPDVYDRVDVGGLHFDYVSGEQRLRDELTRLFPAERRAIDGYFTAIHNCVGRLPLFFAEKLLPPVAAAVTGAALRAPFLRYARRTTGEVLDGIGMSRELKAVLTAQWGDYGLPPALSSFGIHAIVAHHYVEGAAYPIGGSRQIAASLLPTIERNGGMVVVDADVDRVLVERGHASGVVMKDGRNLRATTVISDAGVRRTMGSLLRECDSPQVRRVAAGLTDCPSSGGHFCLYVGLTSSALTLPQSNRWIHPSPDFDRNFWPYMNDISAPFPFVFMTSPSAKDPSFQQRHPDRHTIEVVTPAPYNVFRSWADTRWQRRGDDYARLKQGIADRLLAELYRHFPQAAGAVETWELSTPLSTQHFDNAPEGGMYGLAHTPARFARRDLGPRTPIGGLFLTGQDVATEGMMGALSGAVVAASAVLGRNLFAAIPKEEARRRAA